MSYFLQVSDKNVPVDNEGHLKNLSDWNEAVAEALALQENISLSPNHWEVLRHLRQFHSRHHMSPANRALVSLIKRELGESKGHSSYLMNLFRGSPAKTACKIAGLPKPDNCL